MKAKEDPLLGQLRTLVQPAKTPSTPPPKFESLGITEPKYTRTTLNLLPVDDELVSQTIRAAADEGRRINVSQAIRLLIRKAKGAKISAGDCDAVLGEDNRRHRQKVRS